MNENIYLKLDEWESWVLTEILSRFKAKDDDLNNKALQLYERLIELRGDKNTKLDKLDAF
jgi:hypothetical protein